jgi:RNA polymerase sigma-70 factor, ECF subfamily
VLHIFKEINERSSDEALMQAMSKGNRKAFEVLYDRYYLKLLHFAKRLLYEDESLAEDLVQDVFLKIIQQPESYKAPALFSTWIYTLVKNKCFNHLRNEQNRRRLLEAIPPFIQGEWPHATEDQKQLKQEIQRVFHSLSDKEKSLYLLRFEEELSVKKIAEITELPEGSVKSGIFYLLKKFALQLKAYSYE